MKLDESIFKIDPYVRVIGYPEAVQEASCKVRNDLQPHNKITMKLDVSWSCHSHIIGKSGNTIQPVVKRTGVSIHFPDGNKNSNEVKSNQVSINSRGEDLCGLEEARAAIRELTPLTFNFTLPANAPFICINNYDFSAFVDKIHSTYNVKVEIEFKEGDHSIIFGSVKGTELDSARCMEATMLVLQSICRNIAPQISVQMTMEISQHFHAIITNKNCELLKKIMSLTTTKIDFDYSPLSGKEKLQWCHLIISGAIKNVYAAKQKIIGSLPLVVMFDLMPHQGLDHPEIDQIMHNLDVSVMVKNKRMDGRRSIVLKGPERIASNIYKAWQIIAKSDMVLPQVKVPKSYFLAESSPYMEMTKIYDTSSSSSSTSAYCSNTKLLNGAPKTQTPVITEESTPPIDSDENKKILSVQNGEVFQFQDFGSLLDTIADRRAPGCEKKQKETQQKIETTDYYTKRLQATKVMKQPVSPTPRTPNPSWSGFGFSKSTPQYALKEQIQMSQEQALNEWNYWNLHPSATVSPDNNSSSPGSQMSSPKMSSSGDEQPPLVSVPDPKFQMSASSYMDSMMYRPVVCQEKPPSNLSDLLGRMQLDRYADMFEYNNITIENCPSLNDMDLKNLGVDSFGHRRKILMAIKSVEKNC